MFILWGVMDITGDTTGSFICSVFSNNWLFFLVSLAAYGREVPAIIEQPLEEVRIHIGKNTVTYEARLLKALFYEVIGWNK